MDGVSVAASIVGIASAGVQISINLVALAKQISTASDRVSSIGYDVSLTSGVLHQLGELMTQKTTDNGISIFSQGGLESTKASAAVCERIFQQVEIEAKKASEQLRDCKQGRLTGGKIKLSRAEKAKWPFLQPSVDTLRGDLREAKGTLMLILQVTSLALSKRMADLNESTSSSMNEQRDFIRAIIALQQQQEHRLELRGSNPNGILPSQQEVISATSPPRPGSADRTKSVDVVQSIKNPPIPVNASQTRASFAQASKLLYEPTNSAIAMPTGQESAVTFPALSRQDRPRDMKISSVLSGSLKDSKNPRHTSNNDNDHDRPDDFSSVQNRGPIDEHRGGEVSAPNINAELRLFFLKPIVKDFFDKVELSWSVQNSNLQPLAIRKHMANDEQEGLSSVIEMLHQLHAYEQAMVDLEISKYPEGSVLYLRRTKTDIQHRDMVFKAIPGLQFVVQHVIRSFPIPEPVSRYFGAPGGQLVVPMAHVPAPDQNIASPMAGCQICGTNAYLAFRVGGNFVCNACWHVSRIQEHQQQQYQNALRSGQQQAQQRPQQHMRHSNAMHSGLQPAQQLPQQHMQQMSAQQTRPRANTQGQPALQPHSANQDQLLIRGDLATAAAAQQQQQQIQAALLQQQPQQAQMQSQAYAAPQQLQHGQQGDRQRVQPQSYHTAAYDGHLPHVFTPDSAMFYPSSYTSSLEQRPLNPQGQFLSSMRPMSNSWVPPPMGIVAAETPKNPQCWDHGCNGRQFSTLNDLYRHQQEELQAANLHESMPAGGSGDPMTQFHQMSMHAAGSGRERRMKRPRWMVGNDVEEAANEHAEAPVIEVDFSPRPPGRSSRRRTDTSRVSILPRDTPSPAVALPNPEEPLWISITRLDDAEDTSDDENEGNDLDGRRGDDVDVDAVVMKLLEKYTTLFDQSNREH